MTETESRYNRAVELRSRGELENSAEIVNDLWEAGYHEPHAALLAGNLALDFGKYAAALSFHQTARDLFLQGSRYFGGKPSVQREAHVFDLALATSRLRMGLWDAFTWNLFENGRYLQSWAPAERTMPWLGQKEKLLVLFEGGYGDAFLFTRLFQLLDEEQRKNSRFVLNPRFPALRHFARSWYGMPELGIQEEINGFHFSAGLMSLMAGLQISGPDRFPVGGRLELTVQDGPPLSPGAPMIGLCLWAEENGQERQTRSITNPHDLAPLAAWNFVNLSPGRTRARRDPYPTLIDQKIRTFRDTAALISQLSLVITVDTAVLHLAALLGKEVWALIPLASDWKWGTTEDRTPLWPTVRLFRNQSPFSWRDTMEQVARELRRRFP